MVQQFALQILHFLSALWAFLKESFIAQQIKQDLYMYMNLSTVLLLPVCVLWELLYVYTTTFV